MNNAQSPMRPLIRLVPDPNPWDDEAALPKLRLPATIMLALLVLACAVYLPSAASVVYTYVMLAVCIVAYLVVVRSVAACALGALVYLGGAVLGGTVGGVRALCLLVIVAIGAYLVCTVRSYWLLLIPVAAYLVALPICHDAMLAVLAVLAMPGAGVLAHATMKNSGRVACVSLCSLMLAFCGVFGLALLWYHRYGAISLEDIRETLTAVRDQLIASMEQTEYMEVLEQWLEAQNARIPARLPVDRLTPDVYLHTYVNMAFSLLPAMAVLYVNLLSFAAQTACTNAFVGTGFPMMATRSARLFILSVPSAIIFLIASAGSLFSSSPLMLNLTLILLPAMCIVGVYKLIADFKARFSPLTLILILAAVLLAPRLLLFGVAVSGAVTTLIRPLVTKMVLEKAREQLHGDDNDSQDGDDRHDQ